MYYKRKLVIWELLVIAVFRKRATFDIFHHDEDVFFVFEYFLERYNVWVRNLHENFDFFS